MTPYYTDEHCTLWHAKAEDILPTIPDASVSLVLTDPPYWRYKLNEAWDKQWKSEAAYLDWIRWCCTQWQRVLTPNGSLYCFASPVMAWAVEGVIREQFHLLNRITWLKDDGWHKKSEKEETRSFLSPWEAILFAEQRGDQYAAMSQSLHKAVYAPLGRYIQTERQRAGWSQNAVDVALGYVEKNNPERGSRLIQRWEEGSSLPTKEAYERLRALLNNGHVEYLRQEYEYLRQEYEALRRPFHLTAQDQYTDVWTFTPVKPEKGKHECEKPLSLLRHIITTSSRPGDIVLDSCMGSGSTLEAAKQCGRRSIGIEMAEKWCKRAVRRVSQDVIPGLWGTAAPNGHTPVQESLLCP